MKRTLFFFGFAVMLGYAQQAADKAARPTLTLSPAVVLAKIKSGQGVTQTLKMSNMTGGTFQFDLEVQDVVVRNGERIYLPAGEAESSIAASAVITPHSLTVPPMEQGTASVTLTIPQKTALRAVVVYFRGRLQTPNDPGSVGLGASLGALITFEMSDDHAFKAVAFNASPQTETTNQVVSHELVNTGSEVVVPKGATAIIDDSGRSVAKAGFAAHRLLPGERITFSATCPAQLKPGHYRAISSFEADTRIITASGEFSVP
jgi:hypothetical protein